VGASSHVTRSHDSPPLSYKGSRNGRAKRRGGCALEDAQWSLGGNRSSVSLWFLHAVEGRRRQISGPLLIHGGIRKPSVLLRTVHTRTHAYNSSRRHSRSRWFCMCKGKMRLYSVKFLGHEILHFPESYGIEISPFFILRFFLKVSLLIATLPSTNTKQTSDCSWVPYKKISAIWIVALQRGLVVDYQGVLQMHPNRIKGLQKDVESAPVQLAFRECLFEHSFPLPTDIQISRRILEFLEAWARRGGASSYDRVFSELHQTDKQLLSRDYLSQTRGVYIGWGGSKEDDRFEVTDTMSIFWLIKGPLTSAPDSPSHVPHSLIGVSVSVITVLLWEMFWT